MAGTTKSVIAVENNNPENTAIPSGCMISPPSPKPKAMGNVATSVVKDVMIMGRNLSLAACIIL